MKNFTLSLFVFFVLFACTEGQQILINEVNMDMEVSSNSPAEVPNKTPNEPPSVRNLNPLPNGSICTDDSDCQSSICLIEESESIGICVKSCMDIASSCAQGLVCEFFAGYGNICVPPIARDMSLYPQDMELEEADMFIELDMAPPCNQQEVNFTSSAGQEIGRVTLSTPNQVEELFLSSPEGRTNRVSITFNESCNDITVELLENYPFLCYDFNRDPCDFIPNENCGPGIIWHFNGRSTSLGDSNVCRRTPQQQGWTQYHTQIQSCYPVYNGPTVNRFDVGEYNFPLCDQTLRGQYWCASSVDGSPSRCLYCEMNLYVCL